MSKPTNETPRVRILGAPPIFWKKEERENIVGHLVGQLDLAKTPLNQWYVSERMIMKAQLDVIAEDRFRAHIDESTRAEFDDNVNAYKTIRHAQNVETFWADIVAKYNMAPNELIEKLTKDHSDSVQLLAVASEEIEQQKAELQKQHAKYAALEAELVEVKRHTVATDHFGFGGLPAKRPRIAVVANHLNGVSRSRIEGLADVTWIENTDTAKAAAHKAVGKDVFALSSHATQNVQRSIKGTAKSFQTIDGSGSGLERIICEKLGIPVSAAAH